MTQPKSEPPANLQPLFRPGRIGKMVVRNRIVQSPAYTLFASTWGEASDKIIEYYRTRARGGVGLIITENTSIDWEVGRTAGNPLRIDHDRFRAALRDLVEAVQNEGAKIALQLHHTGRQNSAANTETGEPPIAPTAGITSAFGSPPREIRLDELPELAQKYVRGAVRAKQAGFDAVELHGGHGYLLQQFLSPKTNKRTDAYGGSFENRARFPLEVARAVREEVGPDFPLIYRLSLEEPYPGGLTVEDGLKFAKLLEPIVDALDVSVGNYDTGMVTTTMEKPGALLHYALAVRRNVNIPVIGIGRMNWLLEEAATHIGAGELDFVSMARGQLADPEIARKVRRGDYDDVRQCIACNECVSRFLFGGLRTQCVINPELGQERRAQEAKRRADTRQSILVVGGGPAGIQAAIVAAIRGHEVTLIEQSDRLGGLLKGWSAAQVHRVEIERLIAYYARNLERHNVKVLLNTPFVEEMADRHDKVLLATGTGSTLPSQTMIDGADLLISRKLPSAQRLIVFGRTEIAAYAALWLAENGKAVELHSPEEDVAVNVNDMLRGHLVEQLAKLDVPIEVGMDVPSSAETVVWAEPREATQTGEALIDDEDVFVIGTRLRGGGLYEATQSGYWTAARI